MVTHIKVETETLDLLKKRKQELGLRSMDAVIRQLLGVRLGEEDHRAQGSQRRHRLREEPEEDEEEKKERVPQLLSFEILDGKPDALKWFTGLKEEPLQWT